MSRQLLECPDLKNTEIATIVFLTTKYQASESGLSDSQLPFIGETIEYRGLITSKIGIAEGACNQGRWDGMKRKVLEKKHFLFCFIRSLGARFSPHRDTCTEFGLECQINSGRNDIKKRGKLFKKKQLNIKVINEMSCTSLRLFLLMRFSAPFCRFL